jgi:hypothetical protein
MNPYPSLQTETTGAIFLVASSKSLPIRDRIHSEALTVDAEGVVISTTCRLCAAFPGHNDAYVTSGPPILDDSASLRSGTTVSKGAG